MELYIHYLGYGDDFMGIPVSKLPTGSLKYVQFTFQLSSSNYPSKIRNTKDIIYNMVNIINTTVYYMQVRVNPEFPSQGYFCSISLIVYLYEMMDIH